MTAYVLKFIDHIKTRLQNDTPKFQDFDHYHNNAKILLQREVQKAFADDKNSESIKNLGIFKDEQGIIRVGGRLQNSLLPYDVKHPVLIPRQHPFHSLDYSKSA